MQESQKIHPDDKILLGWNAREWIQHEKGTTWWIIAGIAVIIAVIVALIYGQWTTAVVFALLGGTYYLISHEKPRVVPISITEFGVHFGDKFWQYANIRKFWIVYDPPHVTTLHLDIKEGKMIKEIVIQLEDLNPLDVRDTLARQIPEAEGQEERSLDKIARTLKI
ncbi:MAG: hypothetical protein NTZ80_02645 [Patescibacteria group bacterium]|nr:hypothetical protein [Patescibacteria group bacterium]